jgi:hypothetical protein
MTSFVEDTSGIFHNVKYIHRIDNNGYDFLTFDQTSHTSKKRIPIDDSFVTNGFCKVLWNKNHIRKIENGAVSFAPKNDTFLFSVAARMRLVSRTLLTIELPKKYLYRFFGLDESTSLEVKNELQHHVLTYDNHFKLIESKLGDNINQYTICYHGDNIWKIYDIQLRPDCYYFANCLGRCQYQFDGDFLITYGKIIVNEFTIKYEY